MINQEWENQLSLLEEIIFQQKEQLQKIAIKIIPHVTQDDLMQPNDFPELENHPAFRYEEGVLAGLLAAEMALRAWMKNSGVDC